MGASVFDDRTYGSLGDTVERVHVRRTGGLSNGGLGHKILELVGQELASVVRVKRAYDLDRIWFSLARMGVERSNKRFHFVECLALGLHKID